MTQSHSEIFLGDLARAVSASHSIDPQIIASIAQLLGFRFGLDRVSQLDTSRLETGKVSAPSIQTDGLAAQDREGDHSESSVELPSDVTQPIVEYLPAVEKIGLKQITEWPAWERTADVTMRYRPLFQQQWTRGLLTEAVSTWRETGEIDIRRALETMVSGKLAELPRMYLPTLARGCQVMVDVSAGMSPFARDCWQLIDALRSIVGREQIQVFYFKHCPIYGVEAENSAHFVPFKAILTTPVLLLTDLGFATPAFSLRRAMVQDWIHLAQYLRDESCLLLTLVPYPRHRWPRRLSKEMTIIQWDRDTTANAVRRAKEKH